MKEPRSPASGAHASFRSPLEASPELRRHKIERARLVWRIFAAAVALLLLVAALWGGWTAWNIRSASLSAQTPMRADKAALRRLDPEQADLTLLVMRAISATSGPQVVLVRQPEQASGTWALALPAANVAGSDVASDTPAALLGRGRATLIKAVEDLFGSKVGHYVELDAGRLFDAVSAEEPRSASDNAFVKLAATASSSPSATIAALAAAADRYRALRSGRAAVLRVGTLARSFVDAVVSDMGATQLDRFLQRLGADAEQGRLRSAVVPLESSDGERLMSASAARTLGEQMMAGRVFASMSAKVEHVQPASLTVDVLNGAGRDGVAAQAARILRRDGYRVREVGNANQFVYDKTLVVYKTKRAPAESVARDLRIGKVVSSRGMYSFTTDVLVIVGADWPQAP